jgi:hypothetical protein
MTQLIKSHLASSSCWRLGQRLVGQRLVGQRLVGQRLSVVTTAVACVLLRRMRHLRSKQSSERGGVGAVGGATSPFPPTGHFPCWAHCCGLSSLSATRGSYASQERDSKASFGKPKCVLLRAKRGRPALLVLPGLSTTGGPSRRAQGDLGSAAEGRKAIGSSLGQQKLETAAFCSISNRLLNAACSHFVTREPVSFSPTHLSLSLDWCRLQLGSSSRGGGFCTSTVSSLFGLGALGVFTVALPQ